MAEYESQGWGLVDLGECNDNSLNNYWYRRQETYPPASGYEYGGIPAIDHHCYGALMARYPTFVMLFMAEIPNPDSPHSVVLTVMNAATQLPSTQ